MATLLFKAIASLHPAAQAASRAPMPALLLEPGLRRNPGEPSAEDGESGEYNKPLLKWRGLRLRVESPAGSIRRGRNKRGIATWEIRMIFDYGEIEGTLGVDGDPVDFFMGPNPDAPFVYVVHQNRYRDWANYDEDKCMLGFDSVDDAAAAFLHHYTDGRFLGPITVMPVDEFLEKVIATLHNPVMIKAHVGAYLRGGRLVNLKGYDGRQERGSPAPGQASLFLRHGGDTALRDLRLKFDQHGDGFELRHADGASWALLMPDPSHVGKYRYQVYGADGFGRHHTFASREAALADAVANGYTAPDPGSLERLVVAPEWAAGMERQAAAGVTNGEVTAKALEAVRSIRATA